MKTLGLEKLSMAWQGTKGSGYNATYIVALPKTAPLVLQNYIHFEY